MSTPQLFPPVTGHADGEPLLSLQWTSHGTVTVMRIGGELDMSSAPLLTDLVEAVVGSRPTRVVVDMANVRFLCAAGLRALIQTRDMIIAAGGRLVLRAPSRPTRRILAITRTECLFPHAVDSP